MKKATRFLLACSAALSVCVSLAGQAGPDVVIPAVSSYTLTPGTFTLDEVSRDNPALTFRIGKRWLRDTTPGAYSLSIKPKGVTVRAADEKGAFYALQTLRQMRDAGDGLLACCEISDRPRYPYRGLMFDVVRHFRSKEVILRQLDAMAMVKMSRMHFHLTDNEGFRICLDCCPDVARKTAFADARYFHDVQSKVYTYTPAGEPAGYVPGTYYDDGKICGGYYSKDDIREILAYAAERHIEVIPEIEMPGHNRALLTARPDLFCTGHDHSVDNVICVTSEDSFTFFEAVLKEVAELFPSEYIHIGGDEARKGNWTACARCRAAMAREGLTSPEQLQSRFVCRIEKYLNSMGKKLIGWDEILEGGLSENATVMSWRGSKGGARSVAMGHDVIMTPSTYYYFDFAQDAPYKEPYAFNTCLPLRHVYSYDPEKDIALVLGGKYSPAFAKHILGVQANLWTEMVIKDEHFEYMLWPRAFAVAETGWSEAPKDQARFRRNCERLCSRLHAMGINTFDLSTEVGEREASLREIPRLTRNARISCRIGSGRKWDHASVLTDGHLGGWSLRDTTQWLETGPGPLHMEMDLGAVMPIHYIGLETAEYPLRRRQLPEKVEVAISRDGVTYTPVRMEVPRFPEGRKGFQIVTLWATVATEARYIRFDMNLTSGRGIDLSEVIVN